LTTALKIMATDSKVLAMELNVLMMDSNVMAIYKGIANKAHYLSTPGAH
jgi:hypothetical protein